MGTGKGTGPGGARPGSGPKKNKSGGGMLQQEMQRIAKRHARRCIKVLAEIAENGDDDRVRVSACRELLDRGFGKSPQGVEHSGKGGGPAYFSFDFGASTLAQNPEE